MKAFNSFLKQLLENPNEKTTLEINGKKKRVKGMARFKSVNYGEDEYIKTSFTDGSQLIIIPSYREIYYAEKSLGKTPGISDDTIGKKVIKFNRKTYKLDNKNDYQFCLRVYVGEPNKDIEGECRFSDYVSEDREEMFSLGWLSYNGKRADVLARKIAPEDVSVINN
jgi:hypothetical protein